MGITQWSNLKPCDKVLQRPSQGWCPRKDHSEFKLNLVSKDYRPRIHSLQRITLLDNSCFISLHLSIWKEGCKNKINNLL